jgi:hypothetical protein
MDSGYPDEWIYPGYMARKAYEEGWFHEPYNEHKPYDPCRYHDIDCQCEDCMWHEDRDGDAMEASWGKEGR